MADSAVVVPELQQGNTLFDPAATKDGTDGKVHDAEHEKRKKMVQQYMKKNAKTLHPNSKRMQKWDSIMGLALVYTALITPFEVAFLDTKLDFLFVINRFLDCVFGMDIFINFNLAFMDKKSGKWILDITKIRRRYLKGWFIIDITSTIPYDCIEFVATATSAGSGGGAMENMKMLRMLKLLKLMKLVRLLKSARLIKRFQMILGLTNANAALLKFVTGIVKDV